MDELPDFTIHHIMIYLSAKEVVQTSVLSKKWFNLYVSFAIFDFHELYKWFIGDLSNKNPATFRKNETIRFHKRLNRFTEFVDAFLVRFSNQKLCMQKFRLLIGLLDVEASSFLHDKWIELALRNGVKELDLNVQIYKNAMYTLPWTIFTAASMNALTLEGCKLEHIPEIIRLYSLKCLILNKVAINKEIVQKLTSQCPLLEGLKVSSCVLIVRITISSYRLKKLSISSCIKLKEIEIDTPNLLYFYHSNHPILTPIVNAPCPWELHFKNAIDDLGNKVDLDAQWFLNMKDFLGVSNQIRFLVMDVWSKRVQIA
ncbi:hypothetical protein Ddye_014636 [Dipteronia dyeriana]|uniref:F-box domain-containing protein n=1 Tax=Dipteronia dyeriana TaxID=168575 RepID=A0AAD9X8C9_9ROSI|nr:hypothetical protein Ddye_014636 [Dipteronia dyeriana]